MVTGLVVAALLAGASAPPIAEDGWVLWVETTGIRTHR